MPIFFLRLARLLKPLEVKLVLCLLTNMSPFRRAARLFKANQKKKAPVSLVKITEEFKMQVVMRS